MASSNVLYRNDYSEPYIYQENAQGDTAPKAIIAPPNEKSRATCNCAIVMSAIALLLSIICLAILGWLVVMVVGIINKENDIPSNSQVGVDPSQTTTQLTEAQTTCPPVNCLNGHSSSQPTQTPPTQASSGSAVYIRWGRTVCPVTASLVYKGLAGGKWFEHTGSGSNYLCLPEDPDYDDYQAGDHGERATIYSAEYQILSFPPFEGKHNHDVPCVVCQANIRTSLLMIPAKQTCPDTWTLEYYGYLMAESQSHSSSEFVCVDRNPEIRAGSITDQNGALFYPVESQCNIGNLPCAPYIDGAELTCVVCTK
ncbi:uncharacterized protein [Amphiura filiformis]|uniref:uncharacterized protein n=1 Tax=Amphiura filiformis TaxID=82378 RepID=UPI003B216A81